MTEDNKSLADVLAECNCQPNPEAMKRLTEAVDSISKALNKFSVNVNQCVMGYQSFQYKQVIPEVAELTKTTPYTYQEVLSICEDYGEGYKEIIRKHIEAGTTYEALYDIRAGRFKNRVDISSLLCDESEYKTELENFDWDKRKKSKEEKLPKKLRNGW